MAIAETCVESIILAEELCTFGNKGAISDVGVGAIIAEAAMHGAFLSADINLAGIKNQEYVATARAKKEQLIKIAEEARAKAIAVVKERM